MSRKKILIAESDPGTLRRICGFFHQENSELITAQDGAQVFDLIEARDPELVLLSQNLPVVSGIDICRRIKSDFLLRRTRVVLVTAEESSHAAALCRAAGCDICLTGPLNRQCFIEAMRQLLGIPEPGRIELRTAVRLPVHFNGPDGQSGRGLTVNLSPSGLYLETAQLFPRENRLRLNLRLLDAETDISLLARVAWVNHPEWVKNPFMPTGMGLDLLERQSNDACEYSHFVAGLLAQT